MKTNHLIINGDSRKMNELKDESVHLIITSPPYWQLKDYGSVDQLGFNLVKSGSWIFRKYFLPDSFLPILLV